MFEDRDGDRSGPNVRGFLNVFALVVVALAVGAAYVYVQGVPALMRGSR